MLSIQLIGYYNASDLFAGFSDLWTQLVESDPPFSWGDNNHSLVTTRAILDHMDNVGIEYDEYFVARCEEVDDHFYIDLEN